MPHFIQPDKCIGCDLCAKKCPTNCIEGESKKTYVIYAPLCIDCGVCASYCPVDDCIFDHYGVSQRRINPKSRPYAVVNEDLCTACELCVDACPFGCLEMVEDEGHFFKVALDARPRDCVGCKLCEDVCVQKGAITVIWPDGAYCESLGVSTFGPFRAGKEIADLEEGLRLPASRVEVRA
jgi:NAD-dependent dihydropyrimidine dehydrogenase PreA subunit